MRVNKYLTGVLIAAAMMLQVNECLAQKDSLSWNDLKNLSLEELMNIEITSVSRRPEQLEQAASAIQVITQADIRNSGAKTLPEALRLASNLQVAQANSSQWAISARGFNNVLANKLLVLIDGRTVYTPLYAGVFWDVQNILLEDVDRIEVISGPGGTLWGANAVNGVINIITKSSKNTKGLFAEATAGSNLPGIASLRYGGQLGEKLAYRIYGLRFKLGNTLLTTGSKSGDEWKIAQGGFRMDWDASEKDNVSFQGNIYDGRPNPDAIQIPVIASGSNLLLHWDHKTSVKSDYQLQIYYDHTWRDFSNNFTEDLKTYDIDWQHHYQVGLRHQMNYGADFRIMDHNVTNLQLFNFLPEHKVLYLYSVFLQDRIMMWEDRLYLTLGAKIEHNSYTGLEFQPNGRLTWAAAKNQTIWAAVSKAVRTPARIDRDFSLLSAQGTPVILTNDHFVSATVTAYELGWRIHPVKTLSLSLSTFYNIYDNIRSVEPGPAPTFLPVTFANGVKGESYGVELAITTQVTSWWQLKGGYTFFDKKMSAKPGKKDLNKASAESNDPKHQAVVQSNIKLPANFEVGTVIRYIDKLPEPYVPEYLSLDLRIEWKLSKAIEVNIVGQNLLDDHHPEFIPASPSAREIERSIYGKITFWL
jgi:iron complex outermembrane receptor protein